MAIGADAHLLIQAVVDQLHTAATDRTFGDFAQRVRVGRGSHPNKFREVAPIDTRKIQT